MKPAHKPRVPVHTPSGPHLQPPLADAIPHFDTASHNPAAKKPGEGGVPDEEEARAREQIKCSEGSGGTRREWWSMLTQFVSSG